MSIGLRSLAAAVLAAMISLPLTAMTMNVDTDGVTVRGLPPGSHLILFGVGREPRRDHSAVRRWTEVLTDEDRDGVVRFSSTITNKSIWIAVDLDTGDSVAETGRDYLRRETEYGATLKRNNVGQLSKFENARGVAELLVVRPRRGAWRLSAAKNSSVDEAKGTPDAMRLDASSFRAVAGVSSDAFTHLKHSDVIAMIDPRLMEFYVIHVAEE